MPTADQETRLVLRARAGDREALDALFRAVQKPLYALISSLVGEPHLAEDVLQEVFLLIYRKLAWLSQPELFRPWAYRIATRESFKRIKRERRWEDRVRDPSILEALPQAPSPEALLPELVEQLPDLIGDLSPASRAVIVLHYLHERTLDEVASILDISVGTAKSRLAYGLAGLRKQLHDRRT